MMNDFDTEPDAPS